MSITLKVTPEALKTKAREVDENTNVLQRHFDSIDDIISHSAGYWVGMAGDKARKEFNAQKESTRKVISRFREHPTDLCTMAGVYEENEQALVSVNQELAADVIA